MATSGTTGQTTFDVAQVIEHAFRRATGGLTAHLTAEQLLTARENLFLGLSAFANKGLSLWCVKKHVITAQTGRRTYTLAPGVQDVLNALRRSGTFTDADSIASGTATLTYSEDTQVDAAILELAAGTEAWSLESSDDGVTWTERGTYSGTLTTTSLVSIEVDSQDTVAYWRVTQTTGTTTPASVRFVSASREIPLSQISRDEYYSLPNKLVLGTPLQYMYNKQFAAPEFTVWQVPSTDDHQFVLAVQELVEDVGDFTNTLAVPTRWLDAIIADLTVRTYLELPKQLTNEKVSLRDLREIAKIALDEAANSETDGGTTFVAPDISVYTR